MAITFNCEHCGKSLTTSDDKAGRKAKCPGCSEMITVPGTDVVVAAGDIEEGDLADLPAAPSPARKSSSSAAAGPKTCPMCGAENPPRAKSCQACGEEFEGNEPAPRGKLSHVIIDAGDVLSASWTIFKNNLSILVLMALICIGIGIGGYLLLVIPVVAVMLSLQGQVGQQEAEMIANLLSLPLGLIASVFVSYLNVGVNRLLLAVARGEDAQLGMLFSGGHFMWRSFLIGLLFNMMTTFGIYCCFVPGVLLWLVFWPFLYIIVDQDCPGLDSLTRAKDLTAKNWLSVFLLSLATFGVSVVLTMTCVGIPFGMGFSWLTFAVAYCKMSGQRTAE